MKRGFTLVELLVVVLIIGVLSAIAIPMYQGAVDKSHWSTMLPGAKAIKDAEEAIKMTNGSYTDNMANLDVTMNNADLTFALVTPNNTADPNVIRVTNSKLANVRLASYLDDSPLFAGQLHCEALKNDERANKLCGKLLMGQELTEQDGYVGYLLDQDIDKATCDNANRSWANSTGKCYKNDQARCISLNMPFEKGSCGWTDTYTKPIINEGGKCIANSWGTCSDVTINEGGICEGNNSNGCVRSEINNGGMCIATGPGHHGACSNSIINDGGICKGESQDGCGYSTINSGGTCWATGNTEGYYQYNICRYVTLEGGKCVADIGSSCMGITVNDGGVCEANAGGSCTGTYNGTGCCKGTYCPSYAPKCAS